MIDQQSLVNVQMQCLNERMKTNKVNGRVLNWQPKLTHFAAPRYAVEHSEASATLQLPQAVDLRPYCSPIVDQGELGSCTGNAIAGALEFLEVLGERKGIPLPEDFTDTKGFDPISRLFIYYNERDMEGSVSEDAGAAISDGILSVKQTGFCRESVWPYHINQFAVKPPVTAYTEAKKHKALYHYSIESMSDITRCLANGFPVVAGIAIYQSFMTQQVASTGIVPYPSSRESMLGGHAICLVGYDLHDNTAWGRNSWGTGWGMKGYFKIPLSYVTNPRLSSDQWTLRYTP